MRGAQPAGNNPLPRELGQVLINCCPLIDECSGNGVVNSPEVLSFSQEMGTTREAGERTQG